MEGGGGAVEGGTVMTGSEGGEANSEGARPQTTWSPSTTVVMVGTTKTTLTTTDGATTTFTAVVVGNQSLVKQRPDRTGRDS
jgi:hypothetical protein